MQDNMTIPAATPTGVPGARRDHFKAVLGFPTMLAVAVGTVVGQGAIVSVLQGVGLGGTDFIAVLAVGFVIAMCNAASFAELSLMFPRAGGLSTYTEVAIGHFPAIVATFSGYLVVAMFGLSAEVLLVGRIMQELFPGTLPPTLIAIAVIAVFTVLNILGTDIFARLQNILTFLMIAVLVVVGLAAFMQVGMPLPPDRAPFADWGMVSTGFFGLVTLGIWAYVGLEFVCPLIEESKNPQRDIPRAMFLGAVVIALVYTVFALGAGTYLSRETLTGSSVPHLEYVVAAFGDSAKLVVALIALTASGSTVNTVLASVSRMLYGMAHNGQAFPVLKRLHPRFQTPWVAILLMGVITGLPLLLIGDKPDAIITLLIAASAAWLLAYIVSHIDVIVLRRRMPQLKRPFRSPWYPVPQIIGIVAMAYAIFNNSPTPEMTRTVYLLTGSVLVIVSIAAALWVKLVMKRGLFEPEAVKHALED
jgi:amino acid transporter